MRPSGATRSGRPGARAGANAGRRHRRYGVDRMPVSQFSRQPDHEADLRHLGCRVGDQTGYVILDPHGLPDVVRTMRP